MVPENSRIHDQLVLLPIYRKAERNITVLNWCIREGCKEFVIYRQIILINPLTKPTEG